MWYFWRQGDRHAATVAAWWVAQNCWNVSVYVKDARAQELPLVGGGEHAWTYLLEQLGLLEQDQAMGTAVRIAGTIVFGYAALRGYTYARGSEGPTGTGPVSTV